MGRRYTLCNAMQGVSTGVLSSPSQDRSGKGVNKLKSGDLVSFVVVIAAGVGRGAAAVGGPCWGASAATTGAAAGAEAAGAAAVATTPAVSACLAAGDARFQVCLAALT